MENSSTDVIAGEYEVTGDVDSLVQALNERYNEYCNEQCNRALASVRRTAYMQLLIAAAVTIVITLLTLSKEVNHLVPFGLFVILLSWAIPILMSARKRKFEYILVPVPISEDKLRHERPTN